MPADPLPIERAFCEVRASAWADLAADGVPEADRDIKFEADMRFLGQRWELAIALPAEPTLSDGGRQAEALFRQEYLRRYGAAATTTSGIVELVGIRAIGIGRMATEDDASGLDEVGDPRRVKSNGTRPVNLERGQPAVPVAVFDGAHTSPGDSLVGPALIDGSDTTIWIPSGMTACIDANRNMFIEANV